MNALVATTIAASDTAPAIAMYPHRAHPTSMPTWAYQNPPSNAALTSTNAHPYRAGIESIIRNPPSFSDPVRRLPLSHNTPAPGSGSAFLGINPTALHATARRTARRATTATPKRTFHAMTRWPHIPDAIRRPDRATMPRPDNDPRVTWLGWMHAGPFRVWHKAYRSDFTQSSHAHDSGSVDFNIAGGGVGAYLGRERESRAGGVEFYRPGGDHTFRTGHSGIRVLHVIFTDELVTPHDAHRPAHHEPFDPDEGAAAGLAARILRELSHADASSPLVIESTAHELLAAMRRFPAIPHIGSRAIAAAVEILRNSPTEAIGLSELAAQVDLHPAHLARSFRQAMGISPGEYHRRARIARAAQGLATGDKPIAGLAGDLGFADQAHLTRWFTRVAGLSPASYRRAMRGR